jgi:hypothetical protein
MKRAIRLAALALALALLLVVALLLFPVWLLLLHHQVRAGRGAGFRCLPLFLARTVAAAAETMVRSEPPPGGWIAVARRADAYLCGFRSPRRWRTVALFFLLEFSPLLRLLPRLSLLDAGRRRAFVDGMFATNRGLAGLVSLSRQVVKIAYYSDPAIGLRLGHRAHGRRDRRRAARPPIPLEVVAH